jgi:hypothetical protein
VAHYNIPALLGNSQKAKIPCMHSVIMLAKPAGKPWLARANDVPRDRSPEIVHEGFERRPQLVFRLAYHE